jgi:hypothetical protein
VDDDVAARTHKRDNLPQGLGRILLMYEKVAAVSRVEGREPPQLVDRSPIDGCVDKLNVVPSGSVEDRAGALER